MQLNPLKSYRYIEISKVHLRKKRKMEAKRKGGLSVSCESVAKCLFTSVIHSNKEKAK